MNARFGSMSDIDESGVGLLYKSSFGDMPSGTKYYGWDAKHMTESQIESKSMELKALTTEGNTYAAGTNYTATSGYLPAVLPIYVDPEIMDITQFDTPLYGGLIPRVSNRGRYADYAKMTARGAAYFAADDGALAEADDTYTRAITMMKYCYAVGRVTGPMLASSKEWINAVDLERKNKFQSLAQHLEAQICEGTNNDSNGFSGLANLITTNTYNGAGTGTVTVQRLRDAIRAGREAYGHPNLIVTDYKTLDDIKALIHNELMYTNNTYKIAWGITAVEFEGLPVIVSLGMPTTATNRDLYVLDTSVCQLRVLQDAVFEELAKTNDSYKFMIKTYLALIVKAENFCYRMYDLA